MEHKLTEENEREVQAEWIARDDLDSNWDVHRDPIEQTHDAHPNRAVTTDNQYAGADD